MADLSHYQQEVREHDSSQRLDASVNFLLAWAADILSLPFKAASQENPTKSPARRARSCQGRKRVAMIQRETVMLIEEE